IIETLDSHFGFSRYAERLGMSANSFDEIYAELRKPTTFVDDISLQLLDEHIQKITPRLVCFSVPFPGNLYSALKCGQYIKARFPEIKIAMGGGFPNTELRSLTDERVFEFVDYITLDDGELPIELVASNVLIPGPENPDFSIYKRTYLAEEGKVIYKNNSSKKDYKQSEIGTPDYSDLKLDKYISVIEITNPMHSLWSDGRWNKLTMAHGCYWGKCTFCDVSLDYIKIYEPIAAVQLADRMEQLMAQTGETGFHFVDEAAPPALMRSLAMEIIKRGLTVTWWANIRFEKSFSKDLCKLLKASGCVAVSGGLEVASDRLLNLIQKGVTVSQVARVTRNFAEAGIMVHSYLMYGYPTQTIQETVDSLEMVRQLFELGLIQSGFWHQFALTAHSPIGLNTQEYGIIPDLKKITFANNDIQFKDKTG
ncbi:radical SAM protein, partial [Marivirga lumbricoides]